MMRSDKDIRIGQFSAKCGIFQQSQPTRLFEITREQDFEARVWKLVEIADSGDLLR